MSGMARSVLVIEDDPHIVRLLRGYLERAGFAVTDCASGTEALRLAGARLPHLVLLDVMLPDLDGFSVCRRLRAESGVPIIMITARADEADILDGLATGADDYITKPFSPRQVVARIEAVLRRARPAGGPGAGLIETGGLRIDPMTREVLVDGRPAALTDTEFRLLYAMAGQPGRAFGREELLEAIYPRGQAYVVDRTVDVHIANLRAKLQDSPDSPRFIQTVWGLGYRFLAPRSREES